MIFEKISSFSGTIQLFYTANQTARPYLTEKTKTQKTKLVISCSDSRIDSANIVSDALHSIFYTTGGQTFGLGTFASLQKKYPFHEIHIYGHQKCGTCHAAYEYLTGKQMQTLQILAIAKAAHPDEKQNVQQIVTAFKQTHNRVYYYHVRIVDGIIEHNNSEISLRDYFPYIIRDEDTYDISNGQF
ncbi:MAG: carbonic anhydrase, partial [Candidatus Woesearchaeota archaeon]